VQPKEGVTGGPIAEPAGLFFKRWHEDSNRNCSNSEEKEPALDLLAGHIIPGLRIDRRQ
jgi:hypothetical protein